jgi:hypothetical protein
MAKKHTLKDPTKKAPPKAAYIMPPPNDDAEAYNWELSRLRGPDPESENKRDPDPGANLFRAPQETMQTMRRYGHDARFICPKYLQIMLDYSTEVRDATVKAAEARYTKEAIGKLQAAITEVFHEKILPDIIQNFERVAPVLAQFYAARMAHVKKFGKE